MPRFRFKAMDSTGGARTAHIEAANADEAMEMLRARGLFVSKRKEVLDDSDAPESSEGLTYEASTDPGRPRPNRWFGAIFTVVGLASTAVGLYGLVDSIWFQMGAERATAVVVDFELRHSGTPGYDILGFTAVGREYRVPKRGSWGVRFGPRLSGIGRPWEVLYPPNHPEEARVAGFSRNYGGPLLALVLGLVFTPTGVLVLRRGFFTFLAAGPASERSRSAADAAC